jgi:hypothetical protein
MIKLLGENTAKNDYNNKPYQSGLNFWIGKLANGTVTTENGTTYTFNENTYYYIKEE